MVDYVSVHGGHSGEFCGHAVDPLADVVDAYERAGYTWFCLTEHMAPMDDRFIPDDERTLTTSDLEERFRRYFAEARRLQAEPRRAEIFVGFETEAFSGYVETVTALIEEHQPDVIVGSVHHVHDEPFDCSPAYYDRAIERAGGIEALYCDYFDLQLELINALEPTIVGHFDLIRIFDPDYKDRWTVPAIRERAIRNLDRIGQIGAILDLNVRAMSKGADEPYLAAPWLSYAIDNGLKIAPGDDSHGVTSVAANIDRGIDALVEAGGHTDWPRPVPYRLP